MPLQDRSANRRATLAEPQISAILFFIDCIFRVENDALSVQQTGSCCKNEKQSLRYRFRIPLTASKKPFMKAPYLHKAQIQGGIFS